MKTILYRFLWILIICSVIEFQPVTISGNAKHFIYHDYADTAADFHPYKSIAVLGDLQRTSLWEVMIGREQNDSERLKLVKALREEDPDLLVLLGDMVFDGSSPEQWNYLDTLLTPLRNIPVLPVVGNHEYYGNAPGSPLNQLKCRFPQFKSSTWYLRKYNDLALIFLNSNSAELNDSAWTVQKNWFKKTLNDLDEDPTVKGILVFLHHPPYSNSLITGDALDVQKAFIHNFDDARKTLVLFAGHAHTYERFHMKGKDFIVSGAGGGPRVILTRGPGSHKDECIFKGIRPFTYILVQPEEKSIEITVKGLNKGENNFFILDSLNINYHNITPSVLANGQ